MGLRRRVSIGFLGIVSILILSGMISFFELSVLSNDTGDILDTNRRSNRLSHEMLRAVRHHNNIYVKISAFGESLDKGVSISELDRLDSILYVARTESLIPKYVDSLLLTSTQLREVTNKLIETQALDARYELLREEFPELDSLAKNFVRSNYDEYQLIYTQMVDQIDNFMTQSQEALSPGTERLHHNAYRAVTPVFISLVVMIVVVLMLYYFMLIYCVKPIVVMNRSLKDFIAFKIPFAPKSQNIDELKELSERIDTIIIQNKTNKE